MQESLQRTDTIEVMSILSLILAFTLAPQAVAVRPTMAADGAGLVVSSFYWGQIRKASNTSSLFAAQRAARARRPRRGMEPPPPEPFLRETYALVRNTGSKTVKFVTWQYVFYADAKHERELRRFRFRTKQKLEPGEMKFLTTTVGEKALSSFGEVIIEAVEFEDGSVYPSGARTASN
jgi:hypothetical protein